MIYNDIDPYCCQWLRNLIAAGHLPQGDVIEGDFREVDADDIPETAHWFAGIGGWPYALELAGWRGPVWTASLPCQPLSSAGQCRGHNDERHLWPAFYTLVAKRRPATIFGEQVASKDGREWFAGVRLDLEQLGYACGAADLPAASVGAPHVRQRLFWVANNNDARLSPVQRKKLAEISGNGAGVGPFAGFECGSTTSRVAYASGHKCRPWRPRGSHGRPAPEPAGLRDAERLADPSGMGNTHKPRHAFGTWICGNDGAAASQAARQAIVKASPWCNADWLPCTDGKARRVESGTFPLAHGVSNRVGRLRAYGNAIIPQVAAKFVRAFMDR